MKIEIFYLLEDHYYICPGRGGVQMINNVIVISLSSGNILKVVKAF